MRRLSAFLLLFALPGLAVGQAWDQPQWYAAFELGNSDLDSEESSFQIDDSDTSFGLRFGYRVNSHVSIVGGYMDLGRFDTELLADVDEEITVVGERSSTATAWTAQAELGWEFVGFLHANVGVGVARWRLDLPAADGNDTQDTAPMVRLGLGMDVGGNTRLDLFAQHIARLEANTAGIGLRFDF
ncbi:hypothetical protein J2T60_002259 [Natronospira proteinivora]|uniref:Outer membrane protein beta-barrel domain-containing protein n=1 Tax=Natronospira proteinivora TaxID=1807133 RepID=A0ABT1GAD5_9GAMM|nr:outer membrane beta-barrel protein [Natronospira proteinivora]MCP1728259.1 hypothetical protein [Natronospira proteinivora]